MKVVIDSNRLIAALLKDGTTRSILFNSEFNFVAPEFIKEEVCKYKHDFLRKTGISSNDFELLMALIFEVITLIPENQYSKYLENLKSIISDYKDIPYLACCMATSSQGIWSHDLHFKEQDEVKVFTNIDLLNVL